MKPVPSRTAASAATMMRFMTLPPHFAKLCKVAKPEFRAVVQSEFWAVIDGTSARPDRFHQRWDFPCPAAAMQVTFWRGPAGAAERGGQLSGRPGREPRSGRSRLARRPGG